jgi:aldehyde dehydrogenase (NAD+)/betaine-aldehyde dehydrogenase
MVSNSASSELMLIGGELVESATRQWDESINPATEEIIGRSPAGDRRDVDLAALAAARAWPLWTALLPKERAAILRTFGDRLRKREDDLLRIEVLDTGNTIGPMRMDVGFSVDSLDYYAGLAYEIKGETVPGAADNIHLTVREPFGIVARIAPFNHPLLFAVARTAAALAAGNAVIVKPPETSPLSALVLSEIARDVFPPGVFNVVCGSGAVVGDALVRHPEIKRIAFIGSETTGRRIQSAAAAAGVKHITLELGGKNPMIVFPDVDVNVAANAAVSGMNFAWQGQSCGSTSRLLVHRDIYPAVLERISAIVSSFKIGDPMNPMHNVGPLNSAQQRSKTEQYVAIGKSEGGRLMTGGKRPRGSDFERGFWYEPTVFGDVTRDMRIAREEVFGPILSVLSWSSEDEVVDIANSTQLGLTTSIWTNDINRALRTAKRVRSGHQWINGFGAHYTGVPFGGFKSSGIGREEGIEELLSYTEVKAINICLHRT